MKAAERFFDTNILLYLLSADTHKANLAEAALAQGGAISVQVLTEFAAIAIRKLGHTHAEVREMLAQLRQFLEVLPVGEEVHDLGLALAERHGLSIYDAMIVAAACLAQCRFLVSEDLQHGQVFEQTLAVVNPFKSTAP